MAAVSVDMTAVALDMAAVSVATADTAGYELEREQVVRAASALVRHIEVQQQQQQQQQQQKQSLLADADAGTDDTVVWLLLATKKHLAASRRLKPGRVRVPHALHRPTARLCLITADPQRAFKAAVAGDGRVARVLGLAKLKSKYKTFESRRQLLAEHDVFLADDRIVTYLPALLGKVFYKTGSKRPVPVNLAGRADRGDRGDKGDKGDKGTKEAPNPLPPRRSGPRLAQSVAAPAEIAAELDAALASALVHVSPSASTAVRVGLAHWRPDMIADNVEAVVRALVARFVPAGWSGVRSLHIKTPDSVALPIWQTAELWETEDDVVDDAAAADAAAAAKAGKVKKRLEAGKEKKRVEAGKEKTRVEAREDGQAQQADRALGQREKKRKQRAGEPVRRTADADNDGISSAAKRAKRVDGASDTGGKKKDSTARKARLQRQKENLSRELETVA